MNASNSMLSSDNSDFVTFNWLCRTWRAERSNCLDLMSSFTSLMVLLCTQQEVYLFLMCSMAVWLQMSLPDEAASWIGAGWLLGFQCQKYNVGKETSAGFIGAEQLGVQMWQTQHWKPNIHILPIMSPFYFVLFDASCKWNFQQAFGVHNSRKTWTTVHEAKDAVWWLVALRNTHFSLLERMHYYKFAAVTCAVPFQSQSLVIRHST